RPERFRENSFQHFDIISIFIFIMIVGLGSAMQSMRQSQLFEKRALVAEAEKASAELSFLKAQINPHFLYNTLNNIYTLCLIDSNIAAESIMKLSNIMRYVTDQSEADFVPLQDEIDCISDFIALQKLRLGKKVTLNYTVEGDSINHKITPLLLMTFIENAFKYGLSNHLEALIDIRINIDKHRINFSSENQIFEHKELQTRKGIGIENTKKRLNLLYPGSHDLKIARDNGTFKVLLVLDSK
ncbi:MAG: sensor histidine kinase, partial [Pedobacter sp.]